MEIIVFVLGVKKVQYLPQNVVEIMEILKYNTSTLKLYLSVVLV